MAEASPGLTIIDLDDEFEPIKPPPARRARKPAAKKSAKKPTEPAGDMTVVDIADDPPPAKPAPPPLIPPEDVPDYLDPRDGERVQPDAVLVGTVIDPPMMAYRLLVSGLSWFEIAAQTGYETGADAQRAVEVLMMRAAAEQGPSNRALALRLSVARHEALMQPWWDKATRGHDLGAAAVVSRELAALDKVQRIGEMDAQSGQHGPRIVIAGTEADYVRGLQEVFAQQNAPKGELPPGRGETIDG